jgi:hypothetical protein
MATDETCFAARVASRAGVITLVLGGMLVNVCLAKEM